MPPSHHHLGLLLLHWNKIRKSDGVKVASAISEASIVLRPDIGQLQPVCGTKMQVQAEKEEAWFQKSSTCVYYNTVMGTEDYCDRATGSFNPPVLCIITYNRLSFYTLKNEDPATEAWCYAMFTLLLWCSVFPRQMADGPQPSSAQHSQPSPAQPRCCHTARARD